MKNWDHIEELAVGSDSDNEGCGESEGSEEGDDEEGSEWDKAKY